jgi:tRNA nucleotidyltransferase (CCA-adding enzyme)
MSEEFDAVADAIRERVTPAPEERDRLNQVVGELTERARAAIGDLPVEAKVRQVGSTARDTWLAGERDIDLFVAFPPELDREQLETYGLEVGHAVLPDGHEEFAEHPYVVGEYEGFDVDLVPCYAVEDATEIKSAVDRTPFHTRYLRERIDGLAGDVRVCKQFFSAIGIYGSDLRTQGFSGYLTELLVVEYGGFRPLIKDAAAWHPPVTFDPENHARETFEDPLVVIDPTDPERNVAAVCSADNVARLQHYARELLAEPREELFDADDPGPLGSADVRAAVSTRDTTPVAVRFDAPNLVDDQLWPQLERSREGITGELDRRGFETVRTATLATDRTRGGDAREAALLFELDVAERPAIERHEGPPVHVGDHARDFFEKYANERNRPPYGPFIDGDRYVVEREREYTTAAGFLESDAIFDVALGAHVESALDASYEVLVGDEVARLAETFGVELARYFDPSP